VSEDTPLRKELDAFIKLISVVSITIGIIFFILGFVIKYRNIFNLYF